MYFYIAILNDRYKQHSTFYVECQHVFEQNSVRIANLYDYIYLSIKIVYNAQTILRICDNILHIMKFKENIL